MPALRTASLKPLNLVGCSPRVTVALHTPGGGAPQVTWLCLYVAYAGGHVEGFIPKKRIFSDVLLLSFYYSVFKSKSFHSRSPERNYNIVKFW